jgi:ABC-type nickel/cobalt efflux system permease component RcnA
VSDPLLADWIAQDSQWEQKVMEHVVGMAAVLVIAGVAAFLMIREVRHENRARMRSRRLRSRQP